MSEGIWLRWKHIRMSECHGLVDSRPYKNKKRLAMECNVLPFTILVILKKLVVTLMLFNLP